jgi:putative membrane protein
MSAFAAFIHHLCFIAIMVLLSIELLLLKQPLTPELAKRLLRIDGLYGIAAGLVLIVGALRVMYLEKDAAYYVHSAPFIAKMLLFVAVGLISLYPTLRFIRWSKSYKSAGVPEWSEAIARKLRLIIHLELTLLVLMILCAAMMAKGIGYFGG